MRQNIRSYSQYELQTHRLDKDNELFAGIAQRLAYRVDKQYAVPAELQRAREQMGSLVGVVALMSNREASPPIEHLPIGYGWGGIMNPNTGRSILSYARGQGKAPRQTILGRLHVDSHWQVHNLEARIAEQVLRDQPDPNAQVVLRLATTDIEGMQEIAKRQLGMTRTVEAPAVLGKGLLDEQETHCPYIARSVGGVINHICSLTDLPDVYDIGKFEA